MSAYKTLSSKDIVVSPFLVEKSLAFPGPISGGNNQFTNSSVGIEFFRGTNVEPDVYWQLSPTFNSQSASTTGNITTQYRSLVYRSIRQLYYSNYLTASQFQTSDGSFISEGSYGSPIATASFNEDGSVTGTIQSPIYFNYPQTFTFNSQRFFPTGSNENISVLSIPSKLFGDSIIPNSFITRLNSADYGDVRITDDGEGKLIGSSSAGYETLGDIIYAHGLAIITKQTFGDSGGFSAASGWGSSAEVLFSSSFTLYETQYKCTIKENEFNYSQNPTVLSGSSNSLYDIYTGSYFDPYVTTVGLYNDARELVAVGKLAQPLPRTRNTDTTIMVNIDKL